MACSCGHLYIIAEHSSTSDFLPCSGSLEPGNTKKENSSLANNYHQEQKTKCRTKTDANSPVSNRPSKLPRHAHQGVRAAAQSKRHPLKLPWEAKSQAANNVSLVGFGSTTALFY